jgi:hypothetical protein
MQIVEDKHQRGGPGNATQKGRHGIEQTESRLLGVVESWWQWEV